ncbi:Hermansky-Pudlak syndrome 5 protein-like [Gigantopelta aegis]|uniref:Hermansky-Pudlak syndrome 5 protein-like n=1 Tax=Gigantopelta aegis TaxID=1735272 RepID=UPI001B88A666|nr:Hermansky-Pudlak syndrome 5 protein-like [Gigantopelta aegis]
MLSSRWMHVLTELAPLEGLDGPLSRSARLCYTCISVSKKYLALGSNTGGVYIFSRDSLKHLQVVYADVETSSVIVAALSPNDSAVAFAISSGQVIVMELNIDRRCKPERLRLSTDHVGFTVTALHWDTSSSKLFIGDSVGKISVAYIPSSKAKTLFTHPSEVIVRLDSAVIQLDWWDRKLLVSTVTRSYLLNTNRHQYSQIGKNLRDGEFGSCYFVEPRCQYPVVYCARPGSRVWEVDFEGNVLNTHLFKKLLSVPPLPVIKFRSESVPDFDELQRYDSQSVAFNKMCLIGSFLITWNNKRIYIFDPARVKMILWAEQETAVQDIATQGNEIYIYYSNHSVSRLHLLPLQQCLHLLCGRRKWAVAGHLLAYCDHFVSSSVIQQHIKTDTLVEIIQNITSQVDVTVAEKLQVILEEFIPERGGSDINSGDVESDTNSGIVRLTSGIFVVNEGLPVGIEDQMKASFDDHLDSSEKNKMVFDHHLDSPVKGQMVFDDHLDSPVKGQNVFDDHLDSLEKDKTVFDDHLDSSEKDKTVFDDHLDSSEKDKTVFDDHLDSSEKDKTVFDDHLDFSEKDKTGFDHRLDSSEKDKTVFDDHLDSSEKDKMDFDDHLDSPVKGQNIFEDNSDSTGKGQADFEDISLASETESIRFQIGDLGDEHNSESLTDENLSLKQKSQLLSSADSGNLCHLTECSEHTVIVENGFSKEKELLSNSDFGRINNIHVKENPILIENLCSVTETGAEIKSDLFKGDRNNAMEEDYAKENSVETRETLTVELVSGESETHDMSFTESAGYSVVNGLQGENHQAVAKLISEERPNASTQSSSDNACDNVHLVTAEDDTTVIQDVIVSSNSVMSAQESPSAVTAEDQSQLPVASVSSVAVMKSVNKQPVCDKTSLFSDSSPPSDIVYRSQGHYRRSASTGSLRRLKKKEKKLNSATSLEEEADINLYTKVDLDPDTVSIDTLSSVEEGEITPDTVSLGEIDNVSSYSTHNRSRTPVYLSDHEFIPSLIQRLSAGGVTPGIDDHSSRDGSPSHSQGSSTATSPRTALLSVKESLSNKTKFLFESIRKKSLLGKSPTSAGEPDTKEVPELALSPKPAVVETPDKDLNQNVDEKEWNQFRIDVNLSSLQTATDSTKTKLQDFAVLMNPDLLKSHLLEWVKELHLTLWLLHQEIDKERQSKIKEQRKQIRLKQKQADLLKYKNKAESDQSKNNEEVSEIINMTGQKKIDDSQTDQLDFESSTEDQSVSDITATTAGQSSEELGTSFDSSSKSEPLSHLSSKEELQNKLLSEIADNIYTDSDGKNLDSNSNTCHRILSVETEVQTQDDDVAPIDWLEVCHVTNPFNMPQQFHADVSELTNLCLETGCHGNVLKFVSKHSDPSESEDLKHGNKNNADNDSCMEDSRPCSCVCCLTQSSGESSLQDCTFDKEMAQFVKSYFHCLDWQRVQQTLHGCHRNLFHTWSALVTCSQDIGRTDQVSVKLDNKDIHSATDLLRSGILANKHAFLGHYARLFSINTSHAVEFASEIPKIVFPQDIVNLCWMCSKPVEQFFSKYINLRLGEMPSYLKLCVMKEVCSSSWLRHTALDCLLRQTLQDQVSESDKPRPGSHLISWVNEDMIESVLDLCVNNVEEKALCCCKKYRYWKGCLRFLKRKRAWKEMLWIIVHLGDVTLLDERQSYGYLPQSIEQWNYFLQKYSDAHSVTQCYSSTECTKQFDWSVSLTWQSICELLVKTLGPATAITLLQKFNIPALGLSPQFYQMCLVESQIQQQQRLVLHNMLEKVDTYLWAKRSPHMAPQLLYAVSEEKKGRSTDKESGDDSYQQLFGQISSKRNLGQTAEDSESHWGVPADISSRCSNCNLKLTETVSHVLPGVTVFQCGHTFHRFCIPQNTCLVCDI